MTEFSWRGDGNLRITVSVDAAMVEYTIITDSDDRKRSPHLGNMRKFRFKCTRDSSFGDIHPDRLGLVALLNTLPFCSKELHLEWPVSDSFLEATKIISRIVVTSKDGEIEGIKMLEGGKPSLSFSGGADSVAALGVMPKSTESVFMLRSKNDHRSLYDSDAALESCRQLRNLGFPVHIIESDFEYLRDPIGFPTDLSVSSPIILLAGTKGYSSVAFGTILESAYGTSGLKYRNYEESSHFRLWSTLFESVGLRYSLPVAGVSEVGTAILCRKFAIGRFHQSCIRGKWGLPCNRCWKCFRKNTLMSALDRTEINPEVIANLRNSKEIRKHVIFSSPIKHEGVLTYSLERSGGGGIAIDKLRELVRVGKINTTWMAKWYPNSSNLIDENYSEFTSRILINELGEMSQMEIGELQSWENSDNESRKAILNQFLKSLRDS